MEILGLVNVPLWTLFLIAVLLLLYLYTSINYGVFDKIGVKGPKPLPFVGNILDIARKGFVESESEWRQKYGRVFGIHEGHFPVLMICDVDILKEITVKEFSNFTNRREFGLSKYARPPHSHFLTMQFDDEWRHNRNTQTPTFSGGKLKKMTSLINKAAESMIKAMKKAAYNSEPVDAKRYTGAYTMEVIASTAFGMDLDAQNTEDDPFVKYARKFFEFSILDPMFLLVLILPCFLPIIGALKLPTLPQDAEKFFTKIVRQALAERRENPGKCSDFLEMMANAEREAQASEQEGSHVTTGSKREENHENGDTAWVDKRKGKGLSDSEILAACILFFSAGYDTTATTLTHALYHLALNPDVQDKLIDEIDEHFPPGKLPAYETVGELQYLDMVIMEVLRINPPAARVDRVCKRDTEIRGLYIPAGTVVGLPIYTIHHDAEYWPDPDVFDPERFSPENKKTHHPLQWIPFGYGPRNCIGMRLAILEMKLALIHLMKSFRFKTNSKTKPLKFGSTFLLTNTKDGVWVTPENRH
ncbi:cytochrome P450 3A24-like [Liolophura sinensis]|uniref:cytochrome P450 3A24-like n=1 Tax=Liolophura sinensis TaxID=3198878 RepID=UPI0031581A71